MTEKLNHVGLKCMSCGSEWTESSFKLELNQELILGEYIPNMCKSCDSEDKTAIVTSLVYNVIADNMTKDGADFTNKEANE